MDFWRFAEPTVAIGSQLSGTYNQLFVATSIGLSCLAGITALRIVDRIEANSTVSARWLWLLAGALVMGAGIWSMHFTGMLAFTLPVHMNYDLPVTLISLLPAIVGSGAALYFLTVSKLKLWGLKLQFGALIMALGIGTMHYTGMEAMRMPALLQYDFAYFVLSIVVAHILAVIAIYARILLRDILALPAMMAPLIGGVIMGHAVAGMHYTAMYGASFYALPGVEHPPSGISHATLAFTIAVFALLILLLTILATWIDNFRQLLKRQARTDALTGLPNRESLSEYLDEAIVNRQGNHGSFSMLIMGLDNFRVINNSLGHAAGDEVLNEVAKRLQANVGEGCFVGRFAGDEFAIVLTGDVVSTADIISRINRLFNAVHLPVEARGLKLHLQASAGISTYSGENTDSATLIRQAHHAMRIAKEDKKKYCFFTSALEDRAHEQLWLTTELRNALDQNQLELHYQPQVELLTGRLTGLEALVRWRHQKKGWIPPDQFVPVAERMGLGLNLDDFVLKQACRQGKAWTDAGFDFGFIAVNLSPLYLEQPDAVAKLTSTLKQTGMSASRLQLEITENKLINCGLTLRERLMTIRRLGVTLAIDDFGTGYSSLSYLRDLPVDKLKLDQSFVKVLADDLKNRAIPDAVVGMAKGLGLSLIAEGIETEQQRLILMDLGYREGQGFLYSRPLAASDVPRIGSDSIAPAVHPVEAVGE